MSALFVVGVAVAGVLTGSVINALTTRWLGWRVVLPQLLGYSPGPEVLRGAAPRCRECGVALGFGPVPAIPWLPGLGRCRGRGRHPIGRRALVVEAVTAGLFGLAAARFGDGWVLVPVLVLVTGLVAMSVVDLLVMRIPNRFVYGTHLFLVPSIVIVSFVVGHPRALIGAVVGSAAYFAFLFVFHLVSPSRMGFGDVRLAGVMGLVLGWLGWRSDLEVVGPLVWVIWGAMIGSLLGTVAGIVSLVAHRRNRPFPFGPALATGCLIIVLFGADLGLT